MSGLRISPPSEEVLEPGKRREYVYDQVCQAFRIGLRIISLLETV